jgi:hypothetical protein
LPADESLPSDIEKRLWNIRRQRQEPFALAGAEYDRFHEA